MIGDVLSPEFFNNSPLIELADGKQASLMSSEKLVQSTEEGQRTVSLTAGAIIEDSSAGDRFPHTLAGTYPSCKA
jgi:ferric-dicitrate binding protein FerR (iron transport regulator)